jgi:hypothetical protein
LGVFGIKQGNGIIKGCEFINLYCNSSNKGGGLYLEIDDGKEYKVEKSKFINCRADINAESGFGRGGGIYAYNGGNNHSGILKVVGCEFLDCIAHDGGGVYLEGVESEFDDCIFSDCLSYGWGGGIYAEFWGNHNFSRCIFLRCRAETVFYFILFLFYFILFSNN